MKLLIKFLILFSILFTGSVYSKSDKDLDDSVDLLSKPEMSDTALVSKLNHTDPRREKLIGNIIENALETYHYRKYQIDDSISEKAFAKYIESLDYTKQFFTQNDIKELQRFRFSIDDNLKSGQYNLVNRSIEVLIKRIKEAERLRQDIFKGKFEFDKKESFELDPKKRTGIVMRNN